MNETQAEINEILGSQRYILAGVSGTELCPILMNVEAAEAASVLRALAVAFEKEVTEAKG